MLGLGQGRVGSKFIPEPGPGFLPRPQAQELHVQLLEAKLLEPLRSTWDRGAA